MSSNDHNDLSESAARADPADEPRIVINDHPDNHCFGCSPHNAHGLQLRWKSWGERGVEADYVVESRWQGAPGVVHGGVQATILDETIGVAIHEAIGHERELDIVTVDFDLHYRKPVLCDQPLVLRGRIERHEGRDYWGIGEIWSADGALLTESNARWRAIRRPKAEGPPR